MAIGSWAVARGRLVIRAGRCRCGSCRCGSVSYEFPYWIKPARLGRCARRPDGRRARPGRAATSWGPKDPLPPHGHHWRSAPHAAAMSPVNTGNHRQPVHPRLGRRSSTVPWNPCYDAGPPAASVEESSASRITSRNSRLMELETIDAWTSPISCCDNGGRQAGKSLQSAPQVVRSGSFSPRWTQQFKLVVGSFPEADRSSLPALSW